MRSTVKNIVAAVVAAGLACVASPLAANAAPIANKPTTPNNTTLVKPTGQAQLYCQVARSGEFATYQVINKGNVAAAKGTVFAYSVTAPKGFPAPQTYKLKAALAPGKFVNMTKPLSSTAVGTCSPTAP